MVLIFQRGATVGYLYGNSIFKCYKCEILYNKGIKVIPGVSGQNTETLKGLFFESLSVIFLLNNDRESNRLKIFPNYKFCMGY